MKFFETKFEKYLCYEDIFTFSKEKTTTLANTQ